MIWVLFIRVFKILLASIHCQFSELFLKVIGICYGTTPLPCIKVYIRFILLSTNYYILRYLKQHMYLYFLKVICPDTAFFQRGNKNIGFG